MYSGSSSPFNQRWGSGNYASLEGSPAPSLGRVILLGDSIMAQNVEVTAAGGSTVSPIHAGQLGFFNWLQALTGFPFSFRAQNITGAAPYGGDNFSVTGDAFTNIPDRLRQALAANGDIYYFHFGTNDITSSRTAENIIDSYRFCVEKCIASGKMVWLNTIFPRNNDDAADFTGGQNTIRLAVNTALLAFENQYKGRVIVFNGDTALMNTSTGKMISTYASDGIHLNSAGAAIFARNVMIPKLAPFYGLQQVKRNFPEAWHTTNVPYGDLLTNGIFSGTAGAVGTGFTGTVPTSWTTARTDGTHVTTVASIESRTNWNGDSASFVKFLCSTSAGGVDVETHRINPTSTITTGVAIDQWYVCEVEVYVDQTASGTNPLRSIYAELRDNGTNGPISRIFDVGKVDGAVKDYFPDDGAYRLLLRTFPIQARTASGLILRINVDIDGTLTGSRAVYFGQPVVRQVGFVKENNTLTKVEVNTAVAASPNLLIAAESGMLFTNEGATAANYHTLPPAVAGLGPYTFYVQDADGMRIVAGSGDTVRLGASVSAAAGYAESTTIGSSITLYAINATEWVASPVTGTWTVT